MDPENSPAAGGTPPSNPSTDSPQPAGPAPVPPTPPPAAQVVATATRTEREVKLEQELEVERVTMKQREQRINQLEDENKRLKDVTKPARAPKDKKPGWTLLG